MSVHEIELRPCNRPTDASALAIVAAATFLDTFAGILEGPSMIQHCLKNHIPSVYAAYLAHSRTRGCLAEVFPGAAPVGYTLLTEPDLPMEGISPYDVELKRIYLLSRFHGGGTGQRLMDNAITQAKDSGATRLLLGVFARNHRALRFYARNGFTQVATRTFQVGTMICDDLILARPL